MASIPMQTEPSNSKSFFENKKHSFEVKIPNWPYERWELTEKTTRGTTRHDDVEENVSAMHNIPATVGPAFDTFLHCFSHQLDIQNNGTSTEILNQITTMLSESLQELGKSYKCFEKCQLVQAGSVAEKTKIEAPDEFDFLIVMEYFSNKELFQAVVRKDVIRIYVKEPIVLDLLPFNFEDQDQSGTVKYFLDVSLRSKFMELFIEIFNKRLPTGWKWLETEHCKTFEVSPTQTPCSSGIASTLHLVYEKFNLNIDVDLCLCLPISANDFEGALFIPEDVNPHMIGYYNIQLMLFGYINNIIEQSPLELFAILGKEDSFHEAISTRITAPQLELSYFFPFRPEDGRLRAYCIAKCILSAFLPKLSKVFGCKRCCHKLVRSYHLKNILLFMLKNYKEDSHWKEDKVPLRVLEIFSILKQCMIGHESSYDAAVSMHCLPGTLYLENVTNLSPYYESEHGSKFFFTPDSHKPMYQLSSAPVYEHYLTTGINEADGALKEWFEKLNNKPWNSKQLLQDLFNLLKKLNEIVL